MVVIEPGAEEVGKLRELAGRTNGFRIHEGVLVKTGTHINCHKSAGDDYVKCERVEKSDGSSNNITFRELEVRTGIKFNVLVIDCEGCYEDIFDDGIQQGWIKGIDRILIEWDGKFQEDLLLSLGYKLIAVREHESEGLDKGVRVYER